MYPTGSSDEPTVDPGVRGADDLHACRCGVVGSLPCSCGVRAPVGEPPTLLKRALSAHHPDGPEGGDTVPGVMQNSGFATKAASDAKIASLRPPVRATGTRAPRGTGRPTAVLGELVRMPDTDAPPMPSDAARVQSGNHRVVLRDCCLALGWEPDTTLTLTCFDGTAVLTEAADGAGGGPAVRARYQLALPVAARAALGVGEGDTVVAVADVAGGHVRLLGPAALEDASRFSHLPRPMRDALNQLASSLKPRQLSLVLQLLGRFDDDQLAALAELDPAQLTAPTATGFDASVAH